MRKLFILFLLSFFTAFSQNQKKAFQDGEFLKYKISYGLINAGFASLQLNETIKKDHELFHIKGRGWSTGMVNIFFSVEDDYQSYFDRVTLKPVHFIRKIREGGYTKNTEIFFNHNKQQAKVVDHKNNTESIFPVQKDAFDMLSSLFYFRNLNLSDLKKGEVISINMFYDNKMNLIELEYIGREVIKTKLGKMKTIVFRPLVEEGRVFSDKESVLVWFSDDRTNIPVKIKASILVGSIKFELVDVKNLTGKLPLVF